MTSNGIFLSYLYLSHTFLPPLLLCRFIEIEFTYHDVRLSKVRRVFVYSPRYGSNTGTFQHPRRNSVPWSSHSVTYLCLYGFAYSGYFTQNGILYHTWSFVSVLSHRISGNLPFPGSLGFLSFTVCSQEPRGSWGREAVGVPIPWSFAMNGTLSVLWTPGHQVASWTPCRMTFDSRFNNHILSDPSTCADSSSISASTGRDPGSTWLLLTQAHNGAQLWPSLVHFCPSLGPTKKAEIFSSFIAVLSISYHSVS